MSLLFKYEVTGKNFTVEERNGRRSVVPGVPFTFDGDTQEMSGREILALTAGRISTGMIVVFSEIALKISTEAILESARGTYVLHEGKWYEVVSEASANTKVPELQSINHYEYVAEYRELEVI